MALKDRIEADFKNAMKAKDEIRLNCLRMVKSAVANKEIDARVKLDDAGVCAILNSLTKRAKESIESFEAGGRTDLASKEKAELEIIKSYLPQELSLSELAVLVDEAIKEAGASSPKDMGKVMKVVVPKVAGRADGKVLSNLVQEKLRPKA